jgi:tetratricopeptide (TPR) repeat protein
MDNSTHDLPLLLVRYLDGELSGQEKAELEARLEQDSALREQYENLLQTREAIRLAGIREQVSAAHEKFMKENRAPVKKISQAGRIIRYSLSIAAALLVIFGGLTAYNYYTLSAAKVYNQNFFAYEPSTTRDNNKSGSSIHNNYLDKDYDKVIRSANRTTNTEDILLVGLAHMEKKNYPEAIKQFRKILDTASPSRESTMIHAAEFYLALSYIANRDFDFALTLLTTIRSNPDHLYREKVSRKMIRQVERLKWR